MRLIDADAIKKDIARLHILNDEAEIRRAYASNPYSTLSDFEDTLVSVFDDIDDAPTIDADRPKGEWIYGEHDVAMCDGYRCDRCGFFVPWDYEHKSIDFINDYNFCPNCGARMNGGEEE